MEEPPTPVNEGTSAVTGYCPRCKVMNEQDSLSLSYMYITNV